MILGYTFSSGAKAKSYREFPLIVSRSTCFLAGSLTQGLMDGNSFCHKVPLIGYSVKVYRPADTCQMLTRVYKT